MAVFGKAKIKMIKMAVKIKKDLNMFLPSKGISFDWANLESAISTPKYQF